MQQNWITKIDTFWLTLYYLFEQNLVLVLDLKIIILFKIFHLQLFLILQLFLLKYRKIVAVLWVYYRVLQITVYLPTFEFPRISLRKEKAK